MHESTGLVALSYGSYQHCEVVSNLFCSKPVCIRSGKLTHFNEVAGGPLGGPKHLLHSNIDWGQDLIFLRRWLADHPEATPLRVALFAGCNPADIGFADTLPLTDAPPDDAAVPTLEPGWYAVSVNLLYGYGGAARDGAQPSTAAPNVLSALRELTPVARAGYSIYI
jgi:hypothetical protein